MILRVEIAYSANDIIRKAGRVAYERVRAALAGLHDMSEWKEDDEKGPTYIFLGGVQLLLTEHELALFAQLEIPFEVKNFKHGFWDSKPTPQQAASGNVTNIHIAIPNIGLLMIDEVDYEEDCCTERLQTLLNDGWRILAVCPPNGDRRPTYIIGRSKANAQTR